MKSKAKLTTHQKVMKDGEKEIRKRIETEMRSRAISDGVKPVTSLTGIRGSELHSQTSSITSESIHTIVRKLK